MSKILESVLTIEQRADAVAADIQRSDWERARRIDLPAAVAAHAALRAALPARATTGTLYAEFISETLGFTVRIGYEWDGPAYHARHPQVAGAEITEVWVVGAEIAHHLTDRTNGLLLDELTAHLRSAP